MIANQTATYDVRANNRARLLQLLSQKCTSSRTELCEETALKPPTVTRIVRELMEAGIVEEITSSKVQAGPGRRQTGIQIVPDGAFVLGFVLNASGMRVGLSGLDGRIVGERQVSGERRTTPEKTLDALIRAADELIEQHLPHRSRLLAATVACAGEVDVGTGYLTESMALGWRNVPVGPSISQALRLPVNVLNLNVALLDAMSIGNEPAAVDNSILVRIANGIIGGAVRSGGRLLHAPNARPSWLGHFPARGAKGQCFCGQNGCLNTVASGPAMLAALERHAGSAQFDAADFVRNEVKVRRLVKLADQGDAEAKRVVRQGGSALGAFLVPFAGQFGSDTVVVAGFVGRSETYFTAVRQTFQKNLPDSWEHKPSLVADHSTATEAAARVALNRFAFSPLLDLERLSDRLTREDGMAPGLVQEELV